jgi:hypothetical protein
VSDVVVLVSIEGRRAVVWPRRFAKMLLHISKLMSRMEAMEQGEIVLRFKQGQVSAVLSEFHPDAWLTTNTAGGTNVGPREVA